MADLGSFQTQLKFDPKILRINGVLAGDLLQQNNQTLEPTKNILNDSGDATLSLARATGLPGANGSGGLITVVFQAVGRGTTTVTLPQLILKDSTGKPIATPAPALTVNVK